MPYADNQGVRIHYEVEGTGPALVLQHGFGASLQVWQQFGYRDVLSRDHRTILIDARGHGESDKPHDRAAYSLQLRVADVVAVLDALKVPRACYFGYSMGGWIGFGMAKHAPQRLRALILGGAHPYADPTWRPLRDVDGRDAEAFIEALEAVVKQRIPAHERSLVLANDLQALAAAGQERASMEDVLPTMTLPCLLLVGEADARCPAVRRCATQLPNASLATLPGLDHSLAFTRSDLMLPQVIAFLANARRAA